MAVSFLWRAVLGLAALGLGACAAPGAPFEVETRAGYDFFDFPGAGPDPDILTGGLVRPETGAIKGAVILSHGASGTGGRQNRAAEALAAEGYAALILDHFSARGVRSVAEDQIRISEQQMAADLFAARDALSAELGLAPNRIGAVGWSKGATATVLASVARLQGFVAAGPPLAYAAAFYPFCGLRLDEEGLANPLLLLLAEEDDWTPSAPCVRQAEAWAAAGAPVDWVVYPGAEHGFDSGAGRFEVGRAITVRDDGPACALRVDAAGRTVTLDGEHELTTPGARAAYLGDCGVRGVTFAGDDAAGADAIARLLAFVRAETP